MKVQDINYMNAWQYPESVFWGEGFKGEDDDPQYKGLQFYTGQSEANPEEVCGVLDQTLCRLDSPSGDVRVAGIKGGCHVLLKRHSNTTWEVTVAGMSEAARAAMEQIRVLLPPIENNDPNVVPVRFWCMGPEGPECHIRRIDVSSWDSIRENYPTNVREQLDELFGVRDPDVSGGKLILWHGPPGTGKTHCIRALAHDWGEWCDIEYIVDPETLFRTASYMMRTLIGNDRQAGDRWRLIIVEDSGEFIANDPKHKTGQALSRLLNLTDGLLGQGLRLIVLVTTNEPISNIDEAVNRPGRCLSEIHFDPFERIEATAWIKRHGGESLPKGDKHTLAALYHHIGEVLQVKREEQLAPTGTYL